MSFHELEDALRDAQEHASKARGKSLEDLNLARDAVLQAERNLAAAKGEPYAVRLDFPVSWDTGAPSPHLLQNDHRTFLTFFERDIDPDWDGSYVSVRPPGSNVAEELAVVEFECCVSTKMGTPNDEVLHGHPLYGRGLEGYEALKVENSPWQAELETINSVHPYYKPEFWRDLNHYVLPFHDCTFECIARGFKVERFETSLSEVLAEVCKRLVR